MAQLRVSLRVCQGQVNSILKPLKVCDRGMTGHVYFIKPMSKRIMDTLAFKDGNGKEIHHLHDTVQQHFHALKALGNEPSGPFITSVGIEIRNKHCIQMAQIQLIIILKNCQTTLSFSNF